MNYYEHHLGDYAEATAHLSFVEDAAYTRLLRKIYSTERPLPAEKKSVHRLVGARTKEERLAIDVVLDEFFLLLDDGWHNERADREIARYQDKQRKAKASADARWAHTERNANASPDAMRTHSEGNATQADTPTRADARSSLQSPDTSLHTLHPEDAGSGPAPSAAPPIPPPAFDGNNAEILNGKAVVAIDARFELPESWGFDAEALGFKPPEVLKQAEMFRQYWVSGRGAGTRRSVKGWRQTWSHWLDKAAKDHR